MFLMQYLCTPSGPGDFQCNSLIACFLNLSIFTLTSTSFSVVLLTSFSTVFIWSASSSLCLTPLSHIPFQKYLDALASGNSLSPLSVPSKWSNNLFRLILKNRFCWYCSTLLSYRFILWLFAVTLCFNSSMITLELLSLMSYCACRRAFD